MTGIDIPISRLTTLFTRSLWIGLTTRQFNGLCSHNQRDGATIAEVLMSGNEYKEVMFDDRYDALCFFDLIGQESIIDGELTTANVNLICAVNIKKAYPLITSYRATPEVHRDVINLIKTDSTVNVDVNGVISGITAYGALNTAKLKHYDMQPYHTFAILLNLKYYNYC